MPEVDVFINASPDVCWRALTDVTLTPADPDGPSG